MLRFAFCSPLRLFFVLLLMLLAAPMALPARAEVIRQFHSDVRAKADATLDVTETIVMDFEGARRRGIWRKFPLRYNRNGGAYTIHVRNIEVRDENGREQPIQVTYPGGDVSIRIGDPNVYFSGVKTYKISYTLRRAINWFDGKPEIYWNATGDEWPFTMQQASARFYPPPGVALSDLRTDSFYGPPGSTRRAQSRVEDNSVLFWTNQLPPGDGLTFLVGLPANSIQEPPLVQGILWWLADWWPLLVLPIGSAAALTILWNLHGRDAERGLPAQVEWSPPKDLTPAEVGTLVDENCDMADILSTLIDLAARGYMSIEERSTKNFLFMTDHDYVFTRSNQAAGNELKAHETTFLRGVFGGINDFGERATLSSLKNRFYIHLPTIENSIYNSLTAKHLFTANPKTTRDSYRALAFVLGIAGVAAFVFTDLLGSIAWGLGLLGAALIFWFGARAMPAKTAIGSRKLRECVGFQRFVQLAEKDRIRQLVTDDPTIFGRLLPYAMVLGVADEWADKFADLMVESPDWYVSGDGGHFAPRIFVSHLGNGMNTMGSTFSSRPQPQSTAGSGGSGFSSGGGFSGGGFGGGGGGSW